MPDPAELTGIYDLGYFLDDAEERDREGYADYRADEAAHRRNARKRLGMLASFRAEGAPLLDVGCAAGFFVAEARRAGWAAGGIDVSPEMIDWGTRFISPNLATSAFADWVFTPGSMSAVTMWDYLEHAIDPRADLERARRLLAPGGVIAISTGDLGSLFARMTGKRWHLLTPRHHNYFFSVTTLERMLREVGFEGPRFAHPSAWYSTKHLTYKLESLLARGVGRSISHALGAARLGQLEIPVNLFDIMTVLARKPAAPPESRPVS
jgi:2-polyprenyl-3-methyl-5-hydroxy-6-metoxy-1,4-benzoquinol methylase